MRLCRVCNTNKPPEAFPRSTGRICRDCDNRQRREDRAAFPELGRIEYERRRDYYSDKNKRYYSENREAAIARVRAWRLERRMSTRKVQARRKFHERGLPPADLTPEQWNAIVARYEERCAYCGAGGVRLVRDHVKPISRGGRHTASNVVPACVSCNCSKRDREVTAWVGRKNAIGY